MCTSKNWIDGVGVDAVGVVVLLGGLGGGEADYGGESEGEHDGFG